jgi:hypothetical protein
MALTSERTEEHEKDRCAADVLGADDPGGSRGIREFDDFELRTLVREERHRIP